MTAAQIEHARTFKDPEQPKSRFDQLEELATERRRLITVANNRQKQLRGFDERHSGPEAHAADSRNWAVEQKTRAEARRAEVENKIDDFILEAAEAIKAERAAQLTA